MHFDYSVNLSRSDWEYLREQLLFPDDDRARLVSNYFSSLDTEIQEHEANGVVSISSTRLDIDGIRAALQRRQRANEHEESLLQYAFECEYYVARNPHQEYVRSIDLMQTRVSSIDMTNLNKPGSFNRLEDSFPNVA